MTTQANCYIPYPDVPVASGEGVLTGLSFAVKDIFEVAGYPSGWGNPHALALSGIKLGTAPAVKALLDSGARFTGKTLTDELAFSMNGKNAHFGTPRNGSAPERIPGGSSSGSASAVSNGLCDFALGTDTGGSVRAPASHCGLIGLRPSHGRVSLEGCMPLAPSFDTCGWFARDLAVFARVGEVLLGADSAALPDLPRLLLASDVIEQVSLSARAATAALLAQLGQAFGSGVQPVGGALLPVNELYWAFRHIQGWEAWQSHGAFLRHYDVQLGPGVKERFTWSSQLSEEQVAPHWAIRAEFTRRFNGLLGRDGVLVMPTMPDVAPLLSSAEVTLEDYRNQSIRMLCLAGLAGCPQISLPLMHIDGAPLGLSLIGPRGSDQSLIALARSFIFRQ
jgi:amidase